MSDPPGWLPLDEYRAIFSRVARPCVEVVVVDPARGVLLALRDIPPFEGRWHLPGGTILFGERVHDAVTRVARRELGLEVRVGELLGVIEYPSHVEAGIDTPIGLAHRCELLVGDAALPAGCGWFTEPPPGLYAEQREFLARTFGFGRSTLLDHAHRES